MTLLRIHCLYKALTLFLALAALLWAAPAGARVYTIQGDAHLESGRQLVRAALEAAGFEAELQLAPIGNERRNVQQIKKNYTQIDMMPPSQQRLRLARQGKLRMIPIPLDRGMLGYRVCFILKTRPDLLAGVRRPADLARFTMGQLEGTADLEVYRAAGIPCKEVRVWQDGQFAAEMEAGVIDVFPLGLGETRRYFKPHFATTAPKLAVDTHLLLHYPWYRFVWVAAGAENDALYAALCRGFDTIAQNGRFLEIWRGEWPEPGQELFSSRQLIELPNPYYGDAIVPEKYRHLLVGPRP